MAGIRASTSFGIPWRVLSAKGPSFAVVVFPGRLRCYPADTLLGALPHPRARVDTNGESAGRPLPLGQVALPREKASIRSHGEPHSRRRGRAPATNRPVTRPRERPWATIPSRPSSSRARAWGPGSGRTGNRGPSSPDRCGAALPRAARNTSTSNQKLKSPRARARLAFFPEPCGLLPRFPRLIPGSSPQRPGPGPRPPGGAFQGKPEG